MNTPRDIRREAERRAAKYPDVLTQIPHADWPTNMLRACGIRRILRSKSWMVWEFEAPEPAIVRLAVGRMPRAGIEWHGLITWEELQQVKREAGFGQQWALEVFPADHAQIADDNERRHLWIVPAGYMPFAWGGV